MCYKHVEKTDIQLKAPFEETVTLVLDSYSIGYISKLVGINIQSKFIPLAVYSAPSHDFEVLIQTNGISS